MEYQKDIQNRMNRLIGQMSSLRDHMVEDKASCAQNVQQMKAIINGLKRVGSIYLENQIDACTANDKPLKSVAQELKEVTNNLFSL